MAEINASDLFPYNFESLFYSVLNNDYTEFVLPGGRGSCKSSFVSEMILLIQGLNPNVLRLLCGKLPTH